MAATPRLLFAAARNWKRALPLMRDARVPLQFKIGTLALGALIISPIDIFGDIPVLGWFDDALLLTLLCSAFVWIATRMTVKPVRTSAIAVK